MKLFAAIDIGSYEVEMKIFQITSGKGIKEIDCVCHRMELGKDVYRDGRIGVEMTDELCRVLNDFVRIMKGYRVDDWRVCATSAVREAGNQLVFLDRVKRHTGLEVEALNGAPGVYSARYAGDAHNSEANMKKLLQDMEGMENRKAQFRTVFALIVNGKEHLFEGIVKGEITKHRHGTSGFGYDPVFIPEGYTQTYAEMGNELKNKISHRALATNKLCNFLSK